MDPLGHKQVGDRPGVQVAAWNAIVDGVRPFAKQRVAPAFDPPQLFDPNAADILVRNDSGADRAEFDILGLSSPLITHTANSTALRECLRRVALSGISPSSGSRKFCVLQEPIADGLIGRAKITGYTFVYTNGAGSESYAKPVAAQYSALDLAADGSAEILWREGTGSGKLALVRLGATESGAGGTGGGIGTEFNPADMGRDMTVDVYGASAPGFYNDTLHLSDVACHIRPNVQIGGFPGVLLWTHIMDVDATEDIQDGNTRTTGTNVINYNPVHWVRHEVTTGGTYEVTFEVVHVADCGSFKRCYLLLHDGYTNGV